jgi:beta-lactamase superfamily II metal-dependent hydrolase
MNSLLYTVLPVGQGTATLIEVVDQNEVPLSVILIDLGSTWGYTELGLTSTQTITNELQKMPGGPTLDAVFLSHADFDHINLVPVLLNDFHAPSENQARKDTLVINNVWYGGSENQYRSKKLKGNAVKMLAEYAPLSPLGVPLKNTHTLRADHSNVRKPVYSKDGVEIYVLIANTVSEDTYVALDFDNDLENGNDGYLKNTDSLVLMATYGTATKRRFIATGDATGMTMAGCVTYLSFNKNNQARVSPTLSISVPHHGSAVTAYDVLGAVEPGKETDVVAQRVVDDFVNYLLPSTVTVSSGELPQYKLPSARVISDFAKHAGDSTYVDPSLKKGGSSDHFFTSYFKKGDLKVAANATKWPKSTGWWTARTNKAVYSSIYYTDTFNNRPDTTDVPRVVPLGAEFVPPNAPYTGPVPPWARGWEYKVSSDAVQRASPRPHGKPPG